MKTIQEEKILHDLHALHFVTLIKYILHSILNCSIFQSFFLFTARYFVAALAAPMLVLCSELKNLVKSFIYVKKPAHQFFSV